MRKETCKECSKNGCPFAYTAESETIQNYGCLPTPSDIVNMRLKHGKTWACHSNPDKPCLGTLDFLKENNLPHEVIDNNLVTEEDNWTIYCKD